MFKGQYIQALDNRGRFQIPGPFLEILSRESTDGNVLVFVAWEALAVYSQAGAAKILPPFPPNLPASGRLVLLKTLQDGLAGYSSSGLAAIPEAFRRRYWLFPGMRLLLSGQGDFFQIEQCLE